MRGRHPGAARLRADVRGATIMEFALVTPVVLTMLMGGMDLGHTLYMETVLQGSVQRASRSSTLMDAAETMRQAAIDEAVRSEVRLLNATLTDQDIKISRSSYGNFTEAQAAEPEDANQNGLCERGEVWIDRNFNNVYDADGGTAGQGGAKDVAVYSVTVSYPRLFPVAALIGFSDTVQLNATTVLANQPYGDQIVRTGSLESRPC